MILYRRADLETALTDAKRQSLPPDYYLSLSSDSKYPVGFLTEHGLVAYAYDPSLDEREPLDEEDMLHSPDAKIVNIPGRPTSWRGLKNFGMLALLVAALLTLFIGFPIIEFFHDNGSNALIVGNINVNSTGQVQYTDLNIRSQIPML